MNELSEQNLICPNVGKDEKIPRLLITNISKLFCIYTRVMLLTSKLINCVNILRHVVSLQAQQFFWITINMVILTKTFFFFFFFFFFNFLLHTGYNTYTATYTNYKTNTILISFIIQYNAILGY